MIIYIWYGVKSCPRIFTPPCVPSLRPLWIRVISIFKGMRSNLVSVQKLFSILFSFREVIFFLPEFISKAVLSCILCAVICIGLHELLIYLWFALACE